MPRFHFDFMGNRKYLFALSGILLAISIGALLLRGLTFGIEFQGGTVMDFSRGSAKIEQVREAFDQRDVEAAEIQSVEGGGYIVRSSMADARRAEQVGREVGEELGFEEVNVTTIGPGWGRNITNRALIALVLAVLAILLYVSVRFEYKMSVTAVAALVHDIVITLGIYALVGREVTPNTIAALLSILGFSLYDTIVVFHRIKENSRNLTKQSFMGMANDSVNQVLGRSISTTLASLIPVLTLLFFGGSTLKDFAFALTIGFLAGAYSSVGVAAPLYAMWKETEPRYQALKKKFAGAK